MRLLLDTNILIDYLRVAKKDETLFFTLCHKKQVNPVISFVTITELYAGKSAGTAKGEEFIGKLISLCRVVDSDESISVHAGVLMRTHQMSFQDAVIAATAIEHSLELVTRNIKDFKKIPKLRLHKASS